MSFLNEATGRPFSLLGGKRNRIVRKTDKPAITSCPGGKSRTSKGSFETGAVKAETIREITRSSSSREQTIFEVGVRIDLCFGNQRSPRSFCRPRPSPLVAVCDLSVSVDKRDDVVRRRVAVRGTMVLVKFHGVQARLAHFERGRGIQVRKVQLRRRWRWQQLSLHQVLKLLKSTPQ